MFEQHVPEIRQELTATRVSALRRSAEPSAGAFRRAVAHTLVRLGLRLGYDGHVPPFVSQPARREEAPTGVSLRHVPTVQTFRAGITRS